MKKPPTKEKDLEAWMEADGPAESTKRKNLRDLVNEFAEGTTAHGLPLIITSVHWWAKLFWFVAFFAFTIIFCYQGYGLLYDFFHFPYTTRIDLVNAQIVDFPAVTICNMNRMRRSQMVGTRFDGLVKVDGGFDLTDDYSWFWDFSSAFYDDWYSDWDWDTDDNTTTSVPSTTVPTGTNTTVPTGTNTTDPTGTNTTVPTGTNTTVPTGTNTGGTNTPVSGRTTGVSGTNTTMTSENTSDGSIDDGSSSDGSISSYPSFSPDYWFSLLDGYDFTYYDYGWGDVAGENDWEGFYLASKADDFSDFIDVANPTYEELTNYGHQAEDFIQQCTFDKRDCNYTEFRRTTNNFYGNCFTFNHGHADADIFSTAKTGSQYGLHLTLFTEQPEYIGILSPESGVRVSVHGADEEPFPEDLGVTVPTGQATSIGIRQNVIDRLGKPWGNCTNGDNTKHSHEFFEYSHKACKEQCFQKKLIEACGCVTDVNYVDTPKCSYLNETQLRCRQRIEQLKNKEKLVCYCPPSCRETSYSTSLSQAVWPSDKYEQHLYERLATQNQKAATVLSDVETSRKNLVRVRVFFEELNYQRIEQIPSWTPASISGSVGGLLGLYVGISFITMLEICIFFGKVLIYLCSCRCFHRRVNPSDRVPCV